MSLLDEWNSEISTEQLRQSSTAQSLPGAPPDALFGLEQRAEFLCRGRGVAVAFAAANDALFVATSRGFLLRHDVSGITNAVSELEVCKPSADARIRRLFVDPLGLHALLLLQVGSGGSGGSSEVHHVDAGFRKGRALGKLRGVGVSSVAWGHSLQAGAVSNVVLGSESGALYELSIDEGKKERVKQLIALKGDPPAIVGLLQGPLGDGRRLVLALGSQRLYTFVGGPTLEQLFAPYADGTAALKYVELPLDLPPTQLQFLTPLSLPDPAVAEGQGAYEVAAPQVFAVLSPSGLYYGQLSLDPGIADEADHLVKHHLLPAAALQPQQAQQGAPAPTEAPLSLALTEYHFVLLYGSKLQYVNRVSKRVVQEVPLDRFASPLRGTASMPLGLYRDQVAGRVAVLAGDDAYEVDASAEGRDMWRVLLDKADFAAAALHARTPRQRNAVLLAQAESLFAEGDTVAAAELFGKLTSTAPSFEELALRLMEAGDPEALLAFLTTRLDTLGREDRAQATMVATWLTELLLDRVNRALLDQRDEEGAAHYGQLVDQLRGFLSQHVSVLDPGTTLGLLSSYGRVDELVHYARCRGDNEALLEYLLQRGEAEKALEVLRKPSVSPELFYKFATGLVTLAPGPTVQAWIDAQPPLDPRRLLPALLQFGEGAGPRLREALKYVRFCLSRLGSTDAAVHNLAVALLSLEPDSEDALLEYLRTGRDPLGQPLYDAVHALRLVRERGRLRASVQLFCEVGLYEDAVALALSFSRQLATEIACRAGSGGEAGLSRKLWLAIARHIIEQQGGEGGEEEGGRIAEVGSLLEESQGAVRIEDILPLFPDFVEIGAFKDAICGSLEKYNQEIEDLRREMQAATETAKAIREELARLDHRSAALDLAEPCARCGRPLFQPPPSSAGPSGGSMPRLYLFPTGNAFHGSCLCAEVAALAPPQQRARIHKLVERLARITDGAGTEGDGSSPASVLSLRKQLEAEVAGEDPFCGELVARNITKPFVLPSEAALADSWAV